MPRGLALAAVAIAVLAAGCGGDGRRDAVVAYIDDANLIQRRLAVPLDGARRAYTDFSKRDAKLEQIRPRLTKARHTIQTLERRLGRLNPPPEAKRLHALLLELVDAQAGLAHDIELLAEFMPRYVDRLSPLRAVERRLRSDLASARTADAQAAALDHYGRDVGVVVRTLDGLRPPAPLATEFETQMDTLGDIQRGATALARALKTNETEALAARLRQFADAANGGRSLAAQRANIAAVKAYNRRIARLNELAAEVNLERVRIQTTLE